MVDRILAWQPRRSIRGVKLVSFEEYQLKEPLADEPCLPESLLVESLFQLGAWLVVLSSEFTERPSWYASRKSVSSVGCTRAKASVWRSSAKLPQRRRRTRRAESGWRRTIAEGIGCLAAPIPLADYQDPESLRVLFSEIYLPEAGPQDHVIGAPA